MNLTGQNAAKVALGAQANDSVVPDGEPLGMESMSTTFDADLARANLMRVRGDYRKAEEICLQILVNNPKSASTHTLLGDICSDQGRLEQAAQWYEMSLDLDPGSLVDRQKLDDVRAQIQERDHISSVTQLGLPDSKLITPKWMVVSGISIVVVAIAIGYAIKLGGLDYSSGPQVVRTPIKATSVNLDPGVGPTDHVGVKPPIITPGTSPVSGTSTATPVAWPKDDKQLKLEVTANTKWGPRLLSLTQDLKTKITTLSFASLEGESEREVAADFARAVFEATQDPDMVTLKAVRNDKLIYQAEAPREKYAETQTSEWRDKQDSADAWILYILTNELWAKKDGDLNAKPPAGANADSSPPVLTGPATEKSSEKKEGQ